MNIHKSTQSYENWMRSCTAVIEAHLRLKHTQMRESPFLFFRGTFYRWAQLWPDVCASLRDAPKVLAVGDLHVLYRPNSSSSSGSSTSAGSTGCVKVSASPLPSSELAWPRFCTSAFVSSTAHCVGKYTLNRPHPNPSPVSGDRTRGIVACSVVAVITFAADRADRVWPVSTCVPQRGRRLRPRRQSQERRQRVRAPRG